jgi:hypothetical protein
VSDSRAPLEDTMEGAVPAVAPAVGAPVTATVTSAQIKVIRAGAHRWCRPVLLDGVTFNLLSLLGRLRCQG